MSVKKRIIATALTCAVALSMCACAVRLDMPVDISSDDEAKYMGFSACNYESQIKAGQYGRLDVNIKLDYEFEVTWSSSDTSIAVVDSSGRVDGIKPGKVTITAHAKSASVDYEIEITKADKVALSNSTAIVNNSQKVKEMIAQNKANGDQSLYAMIVNEADCTVTVYTYNSSGSYRIPVRAMVCSVGKDGKTPNIEEKITEKSSWVYLSDNKYYQYATYIGEDLMFQSSPYTKQASASLVAEEYNKLGTPATAKNIRLSVSDAKWIYDNCSEGTIVKIVNPSNEEMSAYSPLGVPVAMKLNESSKSLKWDPTDPNKKNPYSKLTPAIIGAEDTIIEMETGYDLYSDVTAVDICGNDISDSIRIDGDFDRNRQGTYVVSYYATDCMGRTGRVDRHITVTDNIEAYSLASTQ